MSPIPPRRQSCGAVFYMGVEQRGFKKLLSMGRLEGLVQGVGESDMAAQCDMLRDGGGTALGQKSKLKRNSDEVSFNFCPSGKRVLALT